MLVVDLLRMTSGLIYGDTTTEPGRMYEHVFEEGKERMHTPEAMTTRNVAMHWQSARCFMRPGRAGSTVPLQMCSVRLLKLRPANGSGNFCKKKFSSRLE